MTELILFWHRRDLRLRDNLGLAMACDRSPLVAGVFCFDPALLTAADLAPVRVAYLLACLQELQESYGRVGGDLILLHGDPRQCLPALAQALGAAAVYWNQDVEPYARQRDPAVAGALKTLGIESQASFWDQLLHAPGEVKTAAGDPYTVYTPFWRNWVKQPKANPWPCPQGLAQLTAAQLAAATAVGATGLPTLEDLGLVWPGEWSMPPGELAAHQRLEDFCQSSQGLEAYHHQRNFPWLEGTSRLSAALKFGAIGIRTVWASTLEAAQHARSSEAAEAIQTWQQELAWREFYQHCLYFFPALATGPYRSQWQDFPWVNHPDQFQAWCTGRTGYPIVDAAMRQLNQTGWMHNRCRMIVASFLTKDLIINWQWGERYFMQHLVDGDQAANNGGWQWSASSGMDPKPLRIFNPATQAQKFDATADYIRQWLPELQSLETEWLVTGKIPPPHRERLAYPAPLVDHRRQQAIFKQKYQAQRQAQARALPPGHRES
ncbi:MAG: deoxyribodipyrimidine photo-lyase [Cyanobacteria bacterium REEB459]|nr:deoxyribodipyrimidine photo-lyase [Cyanobacteria bacterium REEB459]